MPKDQQSWELSRTTITRISPKTTDIKSSNSEISIGSRRSTSRFSMGVFSPGNEPKKWELHLASKRLHTFYAKTNTFCGNVQNEHFYTAFGTLCAIRAQNYCWPTFNPEMHRVCRIHPKFRYKCWITMINSRVSPIIETIDWGNELHTK